MSNETSKLIKLFFTGNTKLFNAIEEGSVTHIEALLKYGGVDTNARSGKSGSTPLIFAAERGEEQVVSSPV